MCVVCCVCITSDDQLIVRNGSLLKTHNHLTATIESKDDDVTQLAITMTLHIDIHHDEASLNISLTKTEV